MEGKNKVTIYDIAKELQLSPATVSRALNRSSLVPRETQEKIQQKAYALGYRKNIFASRLRNQRTNIIATVVPQLNTWLPSTITSGVEVMATQLGYNLVVRQSRNDAQLYLSNIENLIRSRVDGLLITSAEFQNLNLDEAHVKLEIPQIVIENLSDFEFQPDQFEKAYQVTQQMIQQGRKRVMLISSNNKNLNHNELVRGYRQALCDNRIIDEYIVTGFNVDQPDTDSLLDFLPAAPPEAIIFVNNIVATLVIANFESEHTHAKRVENFGTATSLDKNQTYDEAIQQLGKVATCLLISLIENTHVY